MIDKETELHAPIEKWLVDKGCFVKAEVRDIDLIGILNEDIIVAVELKKRLNLEVINQAVQRQKIADLTYIAVEHDYKTFNSSRFTLTVDTIKKLQIGLLTVNFRAEDPEVYEVVKAPLLSKDKMSKKVERERNNVIKEFHKRQIEGLNVGGSNRVKIMTGYRESCLRLAWIIRQEGELSTKEIRETKPEIKGFLPMLNQNHYGWFERVSRGVYTVSDKGKEALQAHEPIIRFFERQRKEYEL